MSKTEKNEKLKNLKAALKARREECSVCPSRGWGDCGYCAVPKWELELAIERIEKELAAA